MGQARLKKGWILISLVSILYELFIINRLNYALFHAFNEASNHMVSPVPVLGLKLVVTIRIVVRNCLGSNLIMIRQSGC